MQIFVATASPDRQLLAPVNAYFRYKTIEWLNYIATELHKGFTPLLGPDTPEEYKPTVLRAALEKKLQYVNEALKDEHFDLRGNDLQLLMPICLRFCAGHTR